MANIKVNLKNIGIEKEEIFEHAAVVEEIHNELIDKSEDEN